MSVTKITLQVIIQRSWNLASTQNLIQMSLVSSFIKAKNRKKSTHPLMSIFLLIKTRTYSQNGVLLGNFKKSQNQTDW